MQVKYKVNDTYATYETSIKKTQISDEELSVQLSVAICDAVYITECMDSTANAVIALQNTLPENVKIICCQSCIHGNFCAVGNYDDEIFCLSDIEVKTIDDMLQPTEDHEERSKRSRTLLYVCDMYQEITDDKFSYNDWMFLATE